MQVSLRLSDEAANEAARVALDRLRLGGPSSPLVLCADLEGVSAARREPPGAVVVLVRSAPVPELARALELGADDAIASLEVPELPVRVRAWERLGAERRASHRAIVARDLALGAIPGLSYACIDRDLVLRTVGGSGLAEGGYDAASLVGARVPDLVPRDTAEAIRRALEPAFGGASAEAQVTTELGPRHLRALPVPAAEGEAPWVVAVATPSSERSSPDDRCLAATFEFVPDGMLIVDPLGKIVLANGAAHTLLRAPPGGLLGRAVDTLVPAAHRAGHATRRAGFARAPHPRAMGGSGAPLTALAIDGAEIAVDISLHPLPRPNGLHTVAAIRDARARRQLEASLQTIEAEQRSLARLRRDILNALPAHVAVLDAAGVVVEVNDRWRQFADDNGLGDERYGVGASYLRVCDNATGQGSEGAGPIGLLLRELLRGAQRSIDLTYPCHSRTEDRWFRMLAAPVPVGGGRGAVVMHIDVTAWKAAEHALKANEESLAITLKSIGDGVIATDLQGRVVRMNPVAESLCGWSLRDAVGRDVDEVFRIVREHDRGPAGSPVQRVLRDGVIVGLANHTLLLNRNGSEVPIADSAAPIFDDGGRVRGVVLVFRDASEERRVKDATERARRELEDIIERVPVAIAIHAEGRILFANHAFGDVVGRPSATLPGTELLDHLDPSDRARAGELVLRERAVSATPDLRFTNASGGLAQVEVAPTRAIHFGGRAALLFAGRDVTEQRRLQARLATTDRLTSIGTLAAGVAHEINNPLSVVAANVPLIQDELAALRKLLVGVDLKSTEAIRAALATLDEELADVNSATERVRRVVHDLKGISRADDDRSEPIDVAAVLSRSIQFAWHEIRHRARLVRELEPVPPVLAHEFRLGQVFINLLVNAAQAIPEGAPEAHEIRVILRSSDGEVVVEVRDTGGGIPSGVLDRIFEPFFTTKPAGIGTGLGLSISRGIIDAMGGEISAFNGERGAVFQVRLPAADGPLRPSSPRASVAPSAPRRARVLVVDDELALGAALRRLIGREHDVLALPTAAEALDRIRAGDRFDLVLCDIMMPSLGGPAFHAEVERLDRALARRFVFMTAGVFSEEAAAFIARTTNRVVEKPIERAVIRGLLAELLA